MAKTTLATLEFGDLEGAVEVAEDLYRQGKLDEDAGQTLMMSVKTEDQDEFLDRLEAKGIKTQGRG